jgi:hypothetical protein
MFVWLYILNNLTFLVIICRYIHVFKAFHVTNIFLSVLLIEMNRICSFGESYVISCSMVSLYYINCFRIKLVLIYTRINLPSMLKYDVTLPCLDSWFWVLQTIVSPFSKQTKSNVYERFLIFVSLKYVSSCGSFVLFSWRTSYKNVSAIWILQCRHFKGILSSDCIHFLRIKSVINVDYRFYDWLVFVGIITWKV